MQVAIIGAGYVGLVTGVGLANIGHDVTCIEIDARKVSEINAGRPPLFEPGLEQRLQAVLASGTFRVASELAEPVRKADVVFICVGTPSASSGEIDLRYVRGAALEIGRALHDVKSGYRVVVVKSTVVPGTTEEVVAPTVWQAAEQGLDTIGIGMNPEFLREGSAVDDFSNPDRIVIGAIDERAAGVLGKLYAPFQAKQVVTNTRSAEMVKYTSNSLLATMISFSNQIAAICEATPGVDVEQVMDALHLDRRLSPVVGVGGNRISPAILSYLRAGCGFGGSCLPKDVKALRAYGKGTGARTELLDAVLSINDSRADHMVRLAEQGLGSLDGRTVAVLGITFKPGTDDVRDSPALRVIALLEAAGANVRAYDPLLSQDAEGTTPGGVRLVASIDAALDGADAALITVASPEFAALDWKTLAACMRTTVVVDGRRVLDDVPGLDALTVLRIGEKAPTMEPERGIA